MVNVFRLQTTQGASIKQLIECLAPLLTDVNFTFTPKFITKSTTSDSEESSQQTKTGGWPGTCQIWTTSAPINNTHKQKQTKHNR